MARTTFLGSLALRQLSEGKLTEHQRAIDGRVPSRLNLSFCTNRPTRYDLLAGNKEGAEIGLIKFKSKLM